jgi:sodium-dependent phosphate cotransporter
VTGSVGPKAAASKTPRRLPAPLQAALVVALLYLFLAGVKLLEGGVKGLGRDFADALFDNVTNPVAGLLVGVLFTVLVQSSSVTTSTIVGLVATGFLDVEAAVPMIMGANIGTTVTNTVVSLAHLRQTEEFRRAFTAATMHDFFNLIAVAILLPLELATKFLSRTAEVIAEFISGSSGATFESPIKGAVSWASGRFEALLELRFSGDALAVFGILLGVGLIFLTLTFITKNMRVLVAARIERSLNAALARSGLVGIAVGMIVTVAVQSSSITTSILIPLVASGILVVRNAYPITLGANIGTTITALLAALAAGTTSALTIAVTHTIFNVVGIIVIYSIPRIRYVPVELAGRLAGFAIERRSIAVIYTFIGFIVVPVVGIVILR